jgi:hypothetical protein
MVGDCWQKLNNEGEIEKEIELLRVHARPVQAGHFASDMRCHFTIP